MSNNCPEIWYKAYAKKSDKITYHGPAPIEDHGLTINKDAKWWQEPVHQGLAWRLCRRNNIMKGARKSKKEAVTILKNALVKAWVKDPNNCPKHMLDTIIDMQRYLDELHPIAGGYDDKLTDESADDSGDSL